MGDTIETEIIDLLWALREEPHDVPRLRKRVADVILQALPELERRGSYWAKLNLVHSCRAFDQNTRASARDASRDTWLTYCLLQLRYAFLPKGAYDENYVPRERDIDRLTFEELGRLVRREFESIAA
jgi:hypothetical protein